MSTSIHSVSVTLLKEEMFFLKFKACSRAGKVDDKGDHISSMLGNALQLSDFLHQCSY